MRIHTLIDQYEKFCKVKEDIDDLKFDQKKVVKYYYKILVFGFKVM